jgi:hypothetical protein
MWVVDPEVVSSIQVDPLFFDHVRVQIKNVSWQDKTRYRSAPLCPGQRRLGRGD